MCMFLFSFCFVSAITTDQLMFYYSNDVDATDNFGDNDGTLQNTPTHNVSGGIINGMYDFDDGSDYITIDPFVVTDQTIAFWFKVSLDTVNDLGLVMRAGTDDAWMVKVSSVGTIEVGVKKDPTGWDYHICMINYTNYTWSNFVWTHEASTKTENAWLNNVQCITDNVSTNDFINENKSIPAFGNRHDGDFYLYDGKLDEISIWNRTLSVADIGDLWYDGNGYNVLTGVPLGSIFINVTHPIDSQKVTGYNGKFFVNVTGNKTLSNCSINNTIWEHDWDNTTFFSFLNVSTVATGNYAVFVNCTNATGGQKSNATRLFSVDGIIPLINAKPLLFDNNTVIWNGSIDTYINFSDDNEIKSINITYNNGTVLFNLTGETITTYQANLTLDTSTHANKINATICDDYDNCVKQDFWFGNINPTEAYISSVFSGTETTHYLNVTVDTVTVSKINATLFFNNTLNYTSVTANFSQALTFTSDETSELVPFYWMINLNDNLYNLTFHNQTFYGFALDNCSTFTVEVLNISIKRDDTQALQATDIDVYFEGWADNRSIAGLFNISWDDQSKIQLCLSIPSATFLTYAQWEYGGTGVYPLETHYLNNFTLYNETQFLTLYLTPNSTAVTFSVTDEDDNDIEDVFIHVLQYDFGTHSHITTEILQTDQQGESIGNIVLTTQWYKFLLVYRGVTILETDPVKISSTTKKFRVNLKDDFFDNFDTWNQIQTSLTFTNATGNFAYTFVNTAGTNVNACLRVKRRTAMTDLLINETCVSSSAGTILVNIGTRGSNTFVATATIEASPEHLEEVLSIHFDDGYKKWGKDGIFAMFFVRLTLAMIGIWNPIVAILLLLVTDIAMVSMGLFGMSKTNIIFYVILAFLTMYRLNRK